MAALLSLWRQHHRDMLRAGLGVAVPSALLYFGKLAAPHASIAAHYEFQQVCPARRRAEVPGKLQHCRR
jgi:hypothetical protein